ncbi:MAG: DEAD/DEAH box helicase [Chloroflexi bacterium]|nr:DEAD/DEAH box helicase [Chloroflexota bacterium]
MDVPGFLQWVQQVPGYQGQVVHRESLPPREPVHGELGRPLDALVEGRLRDLGLLPLYRHQAEAINVLYQGRHVVVATGAASGKSLCYQVPALEALAQDPSSRSLYLFPTKALAQDQLRSLRLLCGDLLPLRAAIYDGDSPPEVRLEARRTAHLLLTNPDMLHAGILPNHRSWSRLFRHLRYVVLDEAHVYRGIFGSHVANVLRRLRRVCHWYGSDPQFILCSATLANPRELAEALVGLPFAVVANDGSPSGGKAFVFWNPPLVNGGDRGRKSATAEAALLMGSLVRERVRTLAFARTRRQVELMYVAVRRQLAEEAPGLVSRISPYRASYLPEERRRIERALAEGKLLGVVSTNALELGIDIGDLEATVLAGYPGSVSSTWQQAGRSGRRQEDSLSVLVARDNPLDQYLMRHPEFFFGRPHEHALTSPQNPYVLASHLLCAAYEMPLTERDAALFGVAFQERVGALEREGALRKERGRWFLSPALHYPAQRVPLRSASSHTYTVVDRSTGALLEEVAEESAFFTLHPGAVYLHFGEPYLVEELDLKTRTAYVTSRELPYYTQCRDLTEIRVIRAWKETRFDGAQVCLGDVEVSNQVVGYRRRAHFTDETMGEEALGLPPLRFRTVALWFDVPQPLLESVRAKRLDLAGGLHGAEHAAIGVLPLFALCDRNDIGGVSTPLHPDTGKPQVFIYDGHAGGIGIAEKGYELVRELWAATLQVVEGCPCEAGCPACIQSPKCGNNNEPLDKQVAAMLLREFLGVGGAAARSAKGRS